MKFFSLLLGLTALAGSAVAEPKEYTPVITTKLGDIRGTVREHESSKIHLFEGIKYGTAQRFGLPKMAGGWQGVYNATKFQYACTQTGIPALDFVDRKQGFSTGSSGEDCLYVNVWTPAKAPAKHNRSVMAWIHGGAFTSGTIFSTTYDARMIALEDVVVVTINYRLGPFGFLYGGTEDSPGNLGFHDQILALKWIQENIESFGGDPNKVTVFGESAGSMSVGALVLSPLTKGLFRRAITQSGAPNSFMGSETKEVAIEKTKALAGHLNCSTDDAAKMLECMRAVKTSKIVEFMPNALVNGEAFFPIYGDSVMPIRPVEALKTGKHNHVDLMFGTTRNEGSGFVAQILPQLNPDNDAKTLTVQNVKTLLKFMFMLFNENANIENIVEYYTRHLTNETDRDLLRVAISDAFGDYHLVCPTILFGETFAKNLPSHSHYAYRLMMPSSLPIMGCHGWMGVCHAEDITYMFGLPVRMHGIVFTEAEYKLSRDMLRAWANFAKEGHPGHMGHVKWHQALDHTKKHHSKPEFVNFMALDNEYEMVNHFYADKCDSFWRPKIFS